MAARLLQWWRRLWQQMPLTILAIVITVMGAAVRLYQFPNMPHGLTWDEAAIGYNGFAVWSSHRDEWLHFFPISFRSFGDYKAPLAIYIDGIFTLIGGLNAWMVRLPFVVFGIAGIPMFMLVSEEIFEVLNWGRAQDRRGWAVWAGFLFALTPWQIHFARIGFESSMMLTFLLFGVWCGLRVLRTRVSGWRQRLLVVGAAVSSVAAMYTYHSAKVALPLFALMLLVLVRRWVWAKRQLVVVMGILAGVLMLPLVFDTLRGAGGTRFGEATVFGLDIGLPAQLSLVGQHFLRHVQLDYLVDGATTTLRHGDGVWGVLLPTTMVLVVAGVLFSVLQMRARRFGQRVGLSRTTALLLFALAWVVIGTLPAAMGQDVPHSNRDLLALPGFLWLATLGWAELRQWLRGLKLNKQVSGSKGEGNLLVKSVCGTFVLLHLFFASAYLHHYFTSFARQSAVAFQDGYVQAAQFAISQEPTADKILFTSTYGEPYIYVLFAHRTSPYAYQGGAQRLYEFTAIQPGDILRNRTAIVATPQELDPKLGDELVYGSDGQVRFVLIKAKELK